MGGGFEIIQKNLRDGLIRQTHRLPRQQAVAQESQRSAVAARQLFQRHAHAGLVGHHRQQLPQQQGGRGAHRQLPIANRRLRKAQQRFPLGRRAALQRQRRKGVQQLEGHARLHPSAGAAIGQQAVQKAFLASVTVLQEGVYDELQGIADPAAVLGHQLVVGENDLLQIQLPLTYVGDIA